MKMTMGRAPIVIICVLIASACGGGDEAESNVDEAIEAANADAGDVAIADSCLADYVDNPCDLFTEQMVRDVVADVPAEVRQQGPAAGYSQCGYWWPSDRTMTVTVMDRTIESAASNEVKLRTIEVYENKPRDRFRRAYLPTAEETEHAGEVFEEELAKKAEQERMTEQEEEIASGLADSAETIMGDSGAVDGVGDMASWSAGRHEGFLHVLHGNTMFELTSSVSDDRSVDREVAIEVAQAIIAACE